MNESALPLWGVDNLKLLDKNTDNIIHEFNELKFGALCLVPMPDGNVYVAFWCYENFVSNIRWLKIGSV